MAFKISELKFPQWAVNQYSIFDMTANWIDKTFFGSEYCPTPEKTMIVALCTNIFGLHRVYAGRKISAIVGWFFLFLSLIAREYVFMLLFWLVVDMVRICLCDYGRVKSRQRFNLHELKKLLFRKAGRGGMAITGSVSVLALALLLAFAPKAENKPRYLDVSRSDLYVSQTDAAYRDLKELEAEIESKSSLMEEMNLYEQNREKNQAQIEGLQKEIADLTAKQQSLQEALQKLQSEIDDKTAIAEELKDIEQSQADKSAELKRLNSEITSLKNEITSLKTDKSNLEKDVTNLTSEKKTLSKETSDLSKEKQRLTKEIAEAKGKGYTLTAGVYTGGEDIPVGTYNINWVSGNGNVFVGYQVNEMFGSDSSWGYIKSYKNAKVESGTRIEIAGNVKVQFKSKD